MAALAGVQGSLTPVSRAYSEDTPIDSCSFSLVSPYLHHRGEEIRFDPANPSEYVDLTCQLQWAKAALSISDTTQAAKHVDAALKLLKQHLSTWEELYNDFLTDYRTTNRHPIVGGPKINSQDTAAFMKVFAKVPDDAKVRILREPLLGENDEVSPLFARENSLPIHLILLTGSLEALQTIAPWMDAQDWEFLGGSRFNLMHMLMYGFRFGYNESGQYAACARVLMTHHPEMAAEKTGSGYKPLAMLETNSDYHNKLQIEEAKKLQDVLTSTTPPAVGVAGLLSMEG